MLARRGGGLLFQSARLVRSTSDPRHGPHHAPAAKPLPIGPRIAVVITGPTTIISSGGSPNSANNTHQLVRAARTTTAVTAATATIGPTTMRMDKIRGGDCELRASSLTDSGAGLVSLVDTAITSNALFALSFHQ